MRGGVEGIRTLETVPRLHTFQACAFDHSATCPWAVLYSDAGAGCKGLAANTGAVLQKHEMPNSPAISAG